MILAYLFGMMQVESKNWNEQPPQMAYKLFCAANGIERIVAKPFIAWWALCARLTCEMWEQKPEQN